MILYQKFYRAVGVRQSIRLKAPRAALLKDIVFPRGSVFHFVEQHADHSLTLGIEESNPFLANVSPQSKVVIFHDTSYAEDIDLSEVNVTRHTLQKPILIKEYHREHPGFVKGFIDRTKASILTNLIVRNHTLVGAEYKYTKNVLSEYHRLHNYWKSVFEDIGKSVVQSTRQHFVPIQLPDIIPSRSQLRKWETNSKQSMWRIIGTQQRYLFAEFYSWLKQDGNSLFPTEPAVLDRLNIIFYHKYFYYVVNLGMLKKWIIPAVGKTDGEQDVTISDAQRYFILGAVKIVMNTVVADDENSLVTQGEDDDIQEENGSDADNLRPSGNGESDEEILSADDSEDAKLLLEQAGASREQRSIVLSRANDQAGISTVSELLKVGLEVEKTSKKILGAKKIEEVFNSEAHEDEHEEDALEALEALNETQERHEEKIEILKDVGYKKYQPEKIDLSTEIDNKVDTMLLEGKLTTGEIKRFKTIGRKWENIKDINGSNRTAVELVNITPDELLVDNEVKLTTKKINGVLDDSMLNSSLSILNKTYVDKVLHRHLLAGAVNLQRGGVCVTDHNVTRIDNAFDAYEIHSFKLIPLEGDESTMKVILPTVQPDGSFMASGVNSRMRLQRVEVPIRKVEYNRVVLTSYVSMFSVTRSDLVAYSQERWLEKQLIGLDNDNPDIKINFANCSHHETTAPIKFTIMSRLVSKIETDTYLFNFDVTKQTSLFGSDLMKEMDKSIKNQMVVGKNKKKNTILIMAEDSTIFECSMENVKDITAIGTIESILGFEYSKAPIDMLDVNIAGKNLPLVFVLGYYLGLGNLLATIDAKFERRKKGERISLEDHQYAIKFADETLVFDRRDYRTMIIVGGFKQIKDVIKGYSVYEFDLKDVYGSVLMDLKIPARHTKELDLMKDLWIDPITRNVLHEIGEPDDFVHLLLRAADMLVVDKHKLFNDESGFRMRGYERFAGFAYKEMVSALRMHNNKPSKANSHIEANPYATWMKILQDQTTTPVEDSNPIHNLKETEVVVYRGQGGRDARSLNSASRKYAENSVGVISDQTVDNGDAGTVIYLTADPSFKSLLGTTHLVKKEDRKDLKPTRLMSTTSLLSPFIDQDDAKRRNFASVQNSRTTSSVGAGLLPVRTGYEKVLPLRTNDLSAVIASEAGVVKEVTRNAIVVKYASGKENRYPLGTRFGKWQGKVIPHDLITELQVGDKFTEGSAISYNPAFFQYDWLAGALSYKQGVLALTALVETPDTLEDGSAMYAGFTDKLKTHIVHTRDIMVDFTQEVSNLLKVGTEVEYETVLCNLLDTLTTASNDRLFTGESREILADISAINPKAESKGKIAGVEVVYCGDPEDMSESLRSIVEKCDRERSNAAKERGKPRQDGSVNSGFRVEGLTLSLNTCIIRVRIKTVQDMGNGSKIVASHQMKSISGRTWKDAQVTESGQIVDLFFGYQSLQNRAVNSAELLGTTNNLMFAATQDAIRTYRGK